MTHHHHHHHHHHHAADEPSLTFRVCVGFAFFLILGGAGVWALWDWFARNVT